MLLNLKVARKIQFDHNLHCSFVEFVRKEFYIVRADAQRGTSIYLRSVFLNPNQHNINFSAASRETFIGIPKSFF